jgi:hypothetical protein
LFADTRQLVKFTIAIDCEFQPSFSSLALNVSPGAARPDRDQASTRH